MKDLKNIKIVFIDIDGTLVNKRKRVTMKTRKMVKRLVDKNIYVVLVSGRDILHTIDKSRKALASNIIISSNGSEIYNYKTNENFYKDDIQYDILKKIWTYCEKNKLELILNGKDTQYGNDMFCSDMYKDKNIIRNVEVLKDKEIFQVIVNSNKYEDMKKCEEFINEHKQIKIANYSKDYIRANYNSKEPYYIFINSCSTDKGIAINKFLEAMNIKKEDTICFGDRINDITMFNSCGKTVAMKNADEDLKKIANYITLSNDENGVADFINRYM